MSLHFRLEGTPTTLGDLSLSTLASRGGDSGSSSPPLESSRWRGSSDSVGPLQMGRRSGYRSRQGALCGRGRGRLGMRVGGGMDEG